MAKKFDSSFHKLVDISDKAHQPKSLVFPKRKFGVKDRCFQRDWFEKWPWLHYNELDDSAYCFICAKAIKEKKVKTGNMDACFISTGYTNWKDATCAFKRHEVSDAHKAAVEVIVTIPKTTKDIGTALSEGYKREVAINRQMLLRIISIVRFLCRQGLPLRGHGDDSDSNFLQALKFQNETDAAALSSWLEKKHDKFTSPQIQNEIIKAMSLRLLRNIISSIQAAPFFTIMIDETTDCTNKEQAVVVIRWVDDSLSVHEEFLGLHEVENIEANTLVSVIEDTLLRANLSIQKIRGQCYDGSSNMSGLRNGVAKQIMDKEARALYTHCYGHTLSLASMDAVKGCQIMKKALEGTSEVTKLIKCSPRRDDIFRKLKSELAPETPGIRVLCPTRWTVRADAFSSILLNYSVLQETWEEAVTIVRDPEVVGRLNGIAVIMEKFEFYYGVTLGELILKHTDNLSKTLQHKSISAAEGQECASLTLRTLQSVRSDDMFDLFWKKVTTAAEKLNLEPPSLPRQRKRPMRYESGLAAAEFHDTARTYYKVAYFEALDLVIASIQERFDQPGFKMYRNLQELLLKAAKKDIYDEEYDFVVNFYGDDLNSTLLKSQLEVLSVQFDGHGDNLTFKDVLEFLAGLTQIQKDFFSEVVVVAKLIYVMPATNATSERSFSALRRIKTYLRNSMSQERLNNVMLLHVHKQKTDELVLEDVAQDFVNDNEHRVHLFGKF